MPVDYSQMDALKAQQAAQQKRIDDAKSTFESTIAPWKAKGINEASLIVDPNYKKAKGAYDAETHAANVELSNLKPQLEKEEYKTNAIKPFAELQDKQELRAKEFRQAFPSILDSKLGSARTEARRNIAEGVGNTRAGFNQRGLLYSGLRSGAEAGLAQDAETGLAQTAIETNQQLMDQGNQLDQDAVDTGLTVANIGQNIEGTDASYRKALIDSLLQQDAERQQVLGGLLGTGTQVAGTGLGAALR